MVRDYQKSIDEMQQTIKNNQQEFNKILAEERKRQDDAQKVFEAKQKEVQAAHQAQIANMNAQIVALANRPTGGCCFPPNALCILENGEKCTWAELKPRQKVWTVDDEGKQTVSEVYFVDGEYGKAYHNYIYYLDSDNQKGCLTATNEHLIYVSEEKESICDIVRKKPIISQNIKPGDYLWVLKDGKMEPCKVTQTKKGLAEGRFYALTLHHRLLVDNVLVSAYEVDQDWGLGDSAIMRALYSVSPAFVNSEANKWFCKQYDLFFEPIAIAFRDLFNGAPPPVEC